MAKGMLTAVGTMIVVILILYLAYVATKYIGRGMSLKTRSRCMKVRDQIILGKDASAAVVQIGTRLFLVGITGSQISLLSEVEEEDMIPVPEPVSDAKSSPDFREMLDKIGKGKGKHGH